MQAYDVKTRESARATASRVLSNSNVRQELEEAMKRRGLSVDVITERINKVASKEIEDPKGEVILKANVELLKILGAYPGSKHLHVGVNLNQEIQNLAFDEVQKQLESIDSELKELLNRNKEPIAEEGQVVSSD